MSNESAHIDDLTIIKLVEINDCLYAKKTREFKNVDKVEIWSQIGAMLNKKATGEQVQKRWESQRSMWSRQHKKYHEQGRSGSGASQDTQEFQYYGEMSFLVLHYAPRQTKSNMKRQSSSTSDESKSFFMKSNSQYKTAGPSNLWNQDLQSNISLSSDDSNILLLPTPASQPQQSSPSNDHNSDSDDCVLSPTAKAVLKEVTNKSYNQFNKTSMQQKFKRKGDTESKVPEPDVFCKKKKKDLDNFLDTSATSMQRLTSCVENILTQNPAIQNPATQSSIDREVLAMSECISVSLKKVKTGKQLPCMIKILEVIQSFSNDRND